MITLNGWQVPGYETRINCGIKLPSEDLSGIGSFALSNDNGIKPGVVSVTTKIPFVDAADLAELITRAKQLDANGARAVLTINSQITEAYKIRKVKFDGDINASEEEGKKGWQVTFKLLEVLSTAERTQQKIDGKAAENSQTQTIDGHATVQTAFDKSEGP
ncbi:hypothetical protein NDQ71_00515 [Pseudoalteromonas sp. KG3]|uniref:baseplate complex protein n=1 Tax=Pseudoalteromonas sp. KG3 TaxID=2951137 RepID=UPI002657F78F|nr:hypothetical protein [Pseudoalteromonas sp. KG3]WKD23630.1 hypothetical protein NDQ71_00515 [Pseudoalteromonas sp. KG3]